MKNYLCFILVLASQISCVHQNEISPRCIIGNWVGTIESRHKDKNGRWTEWEPLQTFLAWPKGGPYLKNVFSKGNKFSISINNQPCDSCNYYENYKLINNRIIFYNPKNNISKLNSAFWDIEKLTENELIVLECGESKRYLKTK